MQTTKRLPRAPDYLDTCARCGDALDEPLGRLGRRAPLCCRCAFLLDDLRAPVRIDAVLVEVLDDLARCLERRRSAS